MTDRPSANLPRPHGVKIGKVPRPTNPQSNRILAREKQRRSLELRKAGLSYQKIAEELGYADASGARKAVVRAFEEIVQEPTQELRSLQVERLNHMLLVLWPKINSGDERAINTALGVLDRLDKIMGTEAPTQVDHTHSGAVLVIDGDKEAFLRNVKKMAGVIDAEAEEVTVPAGDVMPHEPLELGGGVEEVEDGDFSPAPIQEAEDGPDIDWDELLGE